MKEIPMDKIRPEVRGLAVMWADLYLDQRDTVKLASDIQNMIDAAVLERDQLLESMGQTNNALCNRLKMYVDKYGELLPTYEQQKANLPLCEVCGKVQAKTETNGKKICYKCEDRLAKEYPPCLFELSKDGGCVGTVHDRCKNCNKRAKAIQQDLKTIMPIT